MLDHRLLPTWGVGRGQGVLPGWETAKPSETRAVQPAGGPWDLEMSRSTLRRPQEGQGGAVGRCWRELAHACPCRTPRTLRAPDRPLHDLRSIPTSLPAGKQGARRELPCPQSLQAPSARCSMEGRGYGARGHQQQQGRPGRVSHAKQRLCQRAVELLQLLLLLLTAKCSLQRRLGRPALPLAVPLKLASSSTPSWPAG